MDQLFLHLITIINGTLINGSEVTLSTGATSDFNSTACHGMTMLTNGDVIDVRIKNDGGTADVTVTDMNVFIVCHG